MTIDKAVIVNALYHRIKAGDMTIEQVPDAYRADVQELIASENNSAGGDSDGLLSSD